VESKQPVFKSTMFGGFEKKSVLDYIYETLNSTQEAQDRLNAQIEEMSAAREKLEQSVKDMESRLGESEKVRTTLGEELQGVKTKNNELSAMLSTLTEEIDRQKQIVAEKDAQLGSMADEKTELERKNADLEQQKLELQKGQVDVDKATLRIGELMVKSHLESERILEEANAKAHELIDAANMRAAQIEESANKSSLELTEHLGTFRTEVSELEQKLEEAIRTMREKFSAIGEVINQGESHIKGFSRPNSHIVLAPPPHSDEGHEPHAAHANEFF